MREFFTLNKNVKMKKQITIHAMTLDTLGERMFEHLKQHNESLDLFAFYVKFRSDNFIYSHTASFHRVILGLTVAASIPIERQLRDLLAPISCDNIFPRH